MDERCIPFVHFGCAKQSDALSAGVKDQLLQKLRSSHLTGPVLWEKYQVHVNSEAREIW